MRYEVKMAIRFLKAGRGQTLFIILGIAIGVSVQIFLGTLITSLQENLIDATIGNSAHITLTDQEIVTLSSPSSEEAVKDFIMEVSFEENEEKVSDWRSITSFLDQKTELSAVSPIMNGNGSISKGNLRSPLVLRGIISERADKIYDFSSNLIQGDYNLQSNQALIGNELAKKYSLGVGDSFSVEIGGGTKASFQVEGIFSLGQNAVDSSWMFLSLNQAQRLFSSSGDISAIEIQVFDVFEADRIAGELEREMINSDLSNWKVENQSLLGALQSQSSSSYTIQFFVLMAVTLGIASVLSVSVVQKQRQIGILKAMGASNRSSRNIFILQGLYLGLIGSAIGVILGYLLIQGFLFGTSISTGQPLFPLSIRLGQTVIIMSITTIASFVSAIFPARKSSKLNPVEVMKG